VLQTLRRRLQGEREGGFTLIELMVVVLIIAILIAIAIPTFLGARARAQDRAAQSNLRNALTAEKTYYTDKQAYTATGTDLSAIEPSLTYNGDATPATNNQIYVAIATATGGVANDQVTLAAKSASGTCFFLRDIADTASSGTTYGKGACSAPGTATGITFSSTGWQ
jgi:type IV pilus assembly protein PilA